MKTHIVEQDKNGFITPVKYVWLVRQTQPIDYYDQRTIAVYDNEQDAITLARKLNKEYACGVVLNDDGDFCELDDAENLHYYDVDEQPVNPDMNLFL